MQLVKKLYVLNLPRNPTKIGREVFMYVIGEYFQNAVPEISAESQSGITYASSEDHVMLGRDCNHQ